MRLYIDQDSMDTGVIRGLRTRGIDVLTSSEAGTSRNSDDQQLQFATADGRVIFTGNARDFARLHRDWLRRGKSHAGIICKTSQFIGVGQQVRRIHEILSRQKSTTDEIWYL